MRLFIALIIFCNLAHAIDLREYLPDGQNTYLNKNGTEVAKYTFATNGAFNSFYSTYFSMGVPVTIQSWQKQYRSNNSWCTKTYAILAKGINDERVVESGDWYAISGCTPSVALGYKTYSNTNTGIFWSTGNGMNYTPTYNEMQVAMQASAGAAYALNGYQAYSKSGAIEILPTFKAEYGRGLDGVWCAGCGKEYTDVLHIVLYHGTRTSGTTKINCGTYAPLAANGVYYQGFKNYNGYAIELWLDKTKGIIQEKLPFFEDGTFYNKPNCGGDIFDNLDWEKYVDD